MMTFANLDETNTFKRKERHYEANATHCPSNGKMLAQTAVSAVRHDAVSDPFARNHLSWTKTAARRKAVGRTFAVAIVDEDNTFETKLLMKQYEESEELQNVLVFEKTDASTASERLTANEIAGIVIVPDGFTKGIRRGKNIPVAVIGNPERPFQAELLKQVMVSNANLISSAQSGANAAFHYLRKMGLSSEEFAKYRDTIITDFTLQALNRNKIYETETLSAFGGITTVEFYSLSGVLILLLVGGLFGMSLTARSEQTALRERLKLQGVRSGVFFLATFCPFSCCSSSKVLS